LLYRNCFDIQAGCKCTDIIEESNVSRKKIYSFWILWPADKNPKDPTAMSETKSVAGDESDDDETPKKNESKDLKDIIEREVRSQIEQKTHIEEDLKNYKAQDHNVRLGLRVAGVAAGGIV
jgi:hypothetical protein